MDFFDDFRLAHVDVGEVRLRVRHGGSGSPVLLLHGHPRTHTTWHRVAPLLAERHFVACPDLRGYGRSSSPAAGGLEAFSKRAMALDMLRLMRSLGHERFAVVGHDRGSYVALRLALDHPEAVQRAALLDCVPILEALERCDAHFAASWWHWFFFAQTAKPAEQWIARDPDAWYRLDGEQMGARNHADARAALRDPDTIAAMVGDYRAGLHVDAAHDRADRDAGRHLRCPTLIAWSGRDDMEQLYGGPEEIWSRWAPGFRYVTIDSGHHVAEEAPDALVAVLEAFLSESAPDGAD